MKKIDLKHGFSLATLARVWLALVILSLLSLILGKWVGSTNTWLPAVVSIIIWSKAWLVARYFLETYECIPYIRRLVLGFISFAPVMLLLTDTFGPELAGLLQL
jgi:hypothetical protein